MKQILFCFSILLLPGMGLSAGQDAPHIIGSELSILWVIPFVGILLSIAIFPLITPHFWHRHFGKISFFWAAVLIIPFIIKHGLSIILYELILIITWNYNCYYFIFVH